jgi:hypothetical protein
VSKNLRPHRGTIGETAPAAFFGHAAHDEVLKVSGTSGLAVYMALCRLESETPPRFKPAFFASEDKIAFYSGLSARRMRAHLKKLCIAKLVQIHFPRGEGTSRQSRKYTLLTLKDEPTGQTVHGTNCPPDDSSSGRKGARSPIDKTSGSGSEDPDTGKHGHARAGEAPGKGASGSGAETRKGGKPAPKYAPAPPPKAVDVRPDGRPVGIDHYDRLIEAGDLRGFADLFETNNRRGTHERAQPYARYLEQLKTEGKVS